MYLFLNVKIYYKLDWNIKIVLFQVCKTTYEKKCKPSYDGYEKKKVIIDNYLISQQNSNYLQVCEKVPKQKCEYKKKCFTTYTDQCTGKLWLVMVSHSKDVFPP